MLAVTVFTLISLVSSTPIISPIKKEFSSVLPKGFCFLPSELGQGKAVLLEDCNNLGEEKLLWFKLNILPSDAFERVPKPESGIFYQYVYFFLSFSDVNQFHLPGSEPTQSCAAQAIPPVLFSFLRTPRTLSMGLVSRIMTMDPLMILMHNKLKNCPRSL